MKFHESKIAKSTKLAGKFPVNLVLLQIITYMLTKTSPFGMKSGVVLFALFITL